MVSAPTKIKSGPDSENRQMSVTSVPRTGSKGHFYNEPNQIVGFVNKKKNGSKPLFNLSEPSFFCSVNGPQGRSCENFLTFIFFCKFFH